jgi:hypothetical protein
MNTTALKVFVFNVLGLFAAICGLLLAQGLTHPEKAEAYPAIKHTTGFQQVCHQSAVGTFDPIVSPGQEPAGHRHVFFGNTAISNDSTIADLLAGTSNCKFKSTYANTNKSAYWVPDLLLRNGKGAGIQSAHVYYRAGNLSDAEIAKMQAFPQGLKMIVHNVPDSNVYWTCNLGTGKDGDTRYDYPQNCIGGSYNTLHIFFPQCGNGDLDTVDPNKYPVNDHRSHMAFPGKDGQCPEKYPIVYPRINFAVQYQAQNAAGAQLSSGDAYTEAHTDAFEAWGDQQNLQDLIDKCIKSGVNCGKAP